MSNGIGHNTLNDISKVYLSQVAEQTEADEYLETVSKVKKVENEDDKKRWAVDEAVKGQDTQDRKDAAAERSRGVGKLLPKKEGESYAKWTMAKDKWVKRKKGEIDEDKKYGYDKDGNSLNPVDIEKRKRKEDDLFGSPKKKVKKEEKDWIQGAVKRPGAFTKKAKSHDMGVQQFAKYVDDNPKKFDTRTKRQANLAQTFASMKKEDMDEMIEILGEVFLEG